MGFWRFRAVTQISRANCTKIDRDRDGEAACEILALNVDFESPNLDFLGSRKPAHKGIKKQYPRKSRYFTIVGQSFVKTVADRHRHAAYHNKH